MSYYESMQELIGNTPIVRLNRVGAPSDVNLFAKLENYLCQIMNNQEYLKMGFIFNFRIIIFKMLNWPFQTMKLSRVKFKKYQEQNIC